MLFKLFLLFNLLTIGFASDEEVELKSRLIQNYDKSTIPKLMDMDPLSLEMGIALRAFENIDQVDGTILANIWLRYYWNDYRLQWNKTYWNVSKIVMYSDPEADNVIWTPDIYLYNTAELPMENLKYSRMNVYSNGDVIWSRPGLLKSTCKFDLSYYPFDIQKCHMKFGSWVYTGDDLDLKVHKSNIDVANMQLNEEWDLINTSFFRNSKKYECCPESYIDIMFNFTLKRHSQHYTTNIIVPTIATSSLMIISLIVPWDSGERISFVTTVMLSIIVFLLILSENLPKSDANPFLSQLILGLTIFSLVSVFFTVLISSLYTHKKHRGILYRLSKLLGLRKRHKCSTDSSSSINTIYSNISTESSAENCNDLENNCDIELRKLSNTSMIDVDTILLKRDSDMSEICEISEKIKNIEKITDKDSKNSHHFKDGENDCEETAGNVEAIFTLIFFVSFVLYLIYMFAIIP